MLKFHLFVLNSINEKIYNCSNLCLKVIIDNLFYPQSFHTRMRYLF